MALSTVSIDSNSSERLGCDDGHLTARLVMTTLSQNNSVAGSLVLNDYLNTSLQNTQVIGKETAIGRFEDTNESCDHVLYVLS